MADVFDPIWSLGLMSGTSMDGIDVAMVLTDGERVLDWRAGETVGYAAADRAAIGYALENGFALRETPDEGLVLAERAVLGCHAAASARHIAGLDVVPEVVGFHGQTIAHDPAAGWTWQIGDGARLAEALNVPVVWDFRSADMVAGGEGAPLAPFFHFALAKRIGTVEPVAFLNIGGVANVTWVDPRKGAPEEEGALLAFDTGPGNALLNDWMMRHMGEPLDRDGAAAGRGRVVADRLAQNAVADYLARVPPKSLDRNSFALVAERMAGLSVEDGAATLTALTAETIAAAVAHMPAPPSRWLVCGGGRLNPVMMGILAERLNAPVVGIEAVGLDGDMLEAQAFAYLAVRSLRGLPLSAPGTTGCAMPVTGGVVSDPRPRRREHRLGSERSH